MSRDNAQLPIDEATRIQEINRAFRHAYENYLGKPYRDALQKRGFYIEPPGQYLRYVAYEEINQKAGVVYRPNHGLAHTMRVASAIPNVIHTYIQNSNDQAKTRFEALNHPDEITKLKIVSAFFVAGRESEAYFSPHPNAPYQQYRRKSSEAFQQYAEKETTLFTPDEIQFYKNILLNPYFNEQDKLSLSQNDDRLAKMAVIKAVLSTSHALDLTRCFSFEKMDNKLQEIDNTFTSSDRQKKIQGVCNLVSKKARQLILTGDKCKNMIDQKPDGIAVHPEDRMARNPLFIFSSNDPVLCQKLIDLAENIESTELANNIAILLNHAATKGKAHLEELLEKINMGLKKDPKSTEQDVKDELNTLFNLQGRVFKTIRHDENDFWDEFAKSLINPETHRPELRKGERRAWTIRLNDKKNPPEYEIVSTKKAPDHVPLRPQDIKESYTRPQSMSYSNYAMGYNPPYFGHTAERQDILVGVSFHPKNCILQRIMMYDAGTVNRPYDFIFKNSAVNYLRNKLDKKEYLASLEELQKNETIENSFQYNEVMAGFKWNEDGSSHMTVFSNNLESRFLVQLRALDLKQRLEKKFPGKQFDIPISIYPNFSIYDSIAQKKDIEQAVGEARYYKYIQAMEFLNSTQQALTHDQIKEIIEKPKTLKQLPHVFSLLEKLNPDQAKKYRETILDRIVDDSKKLILDAKKNFPNIDTVVTKILDIQNKSSEHYDILLYLIDCEKHHRFENDTAIKSYQDLLNLMEISSSIKIENYREILIKNDGCHFVATKEQFFEICEFLSQKMIARFKFLDLYVRSDIPDLLIAFFKAVEERFHLFITNAQDFSRLSKIITSSANNDPGLQRQILYSFSGTQKIFGNFTDQLIYIACQSAKEFEEIVLTAQHFIFQKKEELGSLISAVIEKANQGETQFTTQHRCLLTNGEIYTQHRKYIINQLVSYPNLLKSIFGKGEDCVSFFKKLCDESLQPPLQALVSWLQSLQDDHQTLNTIIARAIPHYSLDQLIQFVHSTEQFSSIYRYSSGESKKALLKAMSEKKLHDITNSLEDLRTILQTLRYVENYRHIVFRIVQNKLENCIIKSLEGYQEENTKSLLSFLDQKACDTLLQAIINIYQKQVQPDLLPALNHFHFQLLKKNILKMGEPFFSKNRIDKKLLSTLKEKIEQAKTITEIENAIQEYKTDSDTLFSRYNTNRFFKTSNDFIRHLNQYNTLISEHKRYLSVERKVTLDASPDHSRELR